MVLYCTLLGLRKASKEKHIFSAKKEFDSKLLNSVRASARRVLKTRFCTLSRIISANLCAPRNCRNRVFVGSQNSFTAVVFKDLQCIACFVDGK